MNPHNPERSMSEPKDVKELESTAEVEIDSRTNTAIPNASPSTLVPQLEKYDIATLQEHTRSMLAKALVGLLIGSVLGISVYIATIKDTKDTNSEALKVSRELITLLWTPQVTLVSGALGFYFASNKK